MNCLASSLICAAAAKITTIEALAWRAPLRYIHVIKEFMHLRSNKLASAYNGNNTHELANINILMQNVVFEFYTRFSAHPAYAWMHIVAYSRCLSSYRVRA